MAKKFRFPKLVAEQWHSSVLRCKLVEVPEEAQWLWCQIYWTCAQCFHGGDGVRTPSVHACMVSPSSESSCYGLYTHRSKKLSASSKNECLEEEGLKHLFLITSSKCFINVVYLVSLSLEIYSEECFSFYISDFSLVIWYFKDLQGKSVCLKVSCC